MIIKKPIVACDVEIPFLPEWLSLHADLKLYDSSSFLGQPIGNFDALIVRSVTPVSEKLLSGSTCQWVGSVTAGINHIDASLLKAMQIPWAYAAGANAPAVLEYILAALATAKDMSVMDQNATLGIIGLGEVGSRVAASCREQGFSVRCYDPPRAARDGQFNSDSWESLGECDVLIVTASYTRGGAWSSHQLINAKALSSWPRLRGLINAARGEIIDYDALFTQRSDLWTCLDVWPGEPSIDRSFVARATLATPHIAGYSRASKYNLSLQVYQAFCDFFGFTVQRCALDGKHSEAFMPSTDLVQCSGQMKAAFAADADSLNTFSSLRKSYVLR